MKLLLIRSGSVFITFNYAEDCSETTWWRRSSWLSVRKKARLS